MAIQSFRDRFTYANPGLEAALPNLDTLSDQALAALSPALLSMGQMVRRHSILLQQRRLNEIYRVITEQADSRIALRLAAAKDKNGVPIFPNTDSIKEAMFGPPDSLSTTFENESANMFVDGIRRVSAALAAAWLIGQLAQITEQLKHSESLEKQALADLQLMLDTFQDISQDIQQNIAREGDNRAFYFEDVELNLITPLTVEIFMPNTTASNWINVNSYSGQTSTGLICGDIVDAINNLTLNSRETNLVAGAVLAGNKGLHRIDVDARYRDVVLSHEVISIRIRYLGSPLLALPFRWGVDPISIRTETLNSVMVNVDRGIVQAVAVGQTSSGARAPIVLYFRRGPVDGTGVPLDAFGNPYALGAWASANFTFRVSPTMADAVTVVVNRTTDPDPVKQQELDDQRFSIPPLLLLNQLFSLKGTPTRALGALIRNDDPQQADPLAALELVAYTLNELETWLILDVLALPADIQMAVGDLKGPSTSFSNKPRSIRVPAEVVKGSSASAPPIPSGEVVPPGMPHLVVGQESSMLRTLRRKLESVKDKHRVWPLNQNEM